MPADPSLADEHYAWQGLELIRSGKDLISYITRARVPMPKSTREWKERCDHYREAVEVERVATSPRSAARARTTPASLRAVESEVSSARAAATPPR
jgi:hypothetical protein